MCDVIGKPIQQPDGAIKWETECRRIVAPWECPLLLVDMWRPKDGYERRFEIQRKEDYEREEREKEREREGEQQGVVNNRWRLTFFLFNFILTKTTVPHLNLWKAKQKKTTL